MHNTQLDPVNTDMSKSTDIVALNGTQSIAELAASGQVKVTYGKSTITDLAKRHAQIRGLKPGSSSIRTPEMIAEIMVRLCEGETLTSILSDPHMPADSTWCYWTNADPELDSLYQDAQAKGQRKLADLRLDIAAGGTFSSGDARRDELMIKAIDKNIAQRNKREFGERVQHDIRSVNIMLTQTDEDWS